jgi:hypothetical protein
MNYRLIGVIAFGILLVGVIMYWLWPTTAKSPPTTPLSNTTSFGNPAPSLTPNIDTPDGFAVAFYTWYLANYGNNTNEVSAHIGDWLTPSFAANVPTIESQSDADAFFLAQDSPPQDSKITATIVNETASVSDVRVLVSASIGSIAYLVHLIKTDNNWRIDSVSLAS